MRTSTILLLLLLVRIVMAQPTTPAAKPPDQNIQAARALYEAGSAAYYEGRFADAVTEFEAARVLWPSPEIDFNIGKARDRLSDPEAAAAAYERYLAARPVASNAAELRARIALLREPKPKTTTEPEHHAAMFVRSSLAVTAQVPPPMARRRALRTTAWIVGGVALGLVAVGASLAGSAHADYGALSCAPGCADGDWSGIRSREYAGAAILGLAGAALVADVALWVADARRKR